MPSSISNFDFARAGATGFGFLGLGVGVRGLLDPSAYAIDFGVPRDRAANSHALIRLVCGRNVAGGLTLLTLARLNDRRAMAVTILCGLFTGWTDAVVCQQMGTKDKALAHLITSLVLGSIGGYMLYTL